MRKKQNEMNEGGEFKDYLRTGSLLLADEQACPPLGEQMSCHSKRVKQRNKLSVCNRREEGKHWRKGTMTGTFSYRNVNNGVVQRLVGRSGRPGSCRAQSRNEADARNPRQSGTRSDRTYAATGHCSQAPLPGLGRLCYNGAAVNQGLGWGVKPSSASRPVDEQCSTPSGLAAIPAVQTGQEDASRYCPVCSQRLESRRCKLICNVCGYYMSCADYY